MPPLSYLGRRNSRFILNTACILPLTGFLCVYPHSHRVQDAELLWRALNHPLTLEHLRFAGKSYGDDAIKVEPRGLEELIIPNLVLGEFDIKPPDVQNQLVLLEESKSSRCNLKESGKPVSYCRKKRRA